MADQHPAMVTCHRWGRLISEASILVHASERELFKVFPNDFSMSQHLSFPFSLIRQLHKIRRRESSVRWADRKERPGRSWKEKMIKMYEKNFNKKPKRQNTHIQVSKGNCAITLPNDTISSDKLLPPAETRLVRG